MEQKNKKSILQIKQTIKDIRKYQNDYYYVNAFERYVSILNENVSEFDLPKFKFEEFHYSATKKTINDRGYQSLIHYIETIEEGLSQPHVNILHNQPEKSVFNDKKVFIVHGRNKVALNETELLLNRAGLEPIVLNRQVNNGLTLIEKFEKYSDVSYAIILLTPDDVGSYYEDGINPNLQFRARQNVLFELGFFYGKLGRANVCCLIKQSVEKPSDIDGIAYIPFNNSIEEIEFSLLRELKTANLKVRILE